MANINGPSGFVPSGICTDRRCAERLHDYERLREQYLHRRSVMQTGASNNINWPLARREHPAAAVASSGCFFTDATSKHLLEVLAVRHCRR